MKYLSQVLSIEEKQNLFNGAGLKLCVAPTGAGKSFLMIEEMKNEFELMKTPFGTKQVLLLVNRSSLLDQYLDSIDEKFKETFEKEEYYIYRGCVHIMTYQRAYKNIKKEKLFLHRFHLLLMDEAHYFLQDSWNKTTDYVLTKIVERSEQIPCTMFTATPEELIDYARVRDIEMETIDHSAKLKHDRIKCVVTNKHFKDVIANIPLGEKYILFVNYKYSKEQIEKLAEELSEDSRCIIFFHSKWGKNGKNLYKIIAMDNKFKNLAKLHKFDEDGAVANAAVDNGVDFKDGDLKHIILLDHYDSVTMKQMIGRKRFNFNNPNDKLTVWAVNTDRKFLEREREQTREHITMYESFKELSKGEFIERFANRLQTATLVGLGDNNDEIETSLENSNCIDVLMKHTGDGVFVSEFGVDFTLVAKAYYRRNYLNKLLEPKIMLNENVIEMPPHQAMEMSLKQMGFDNIVVDNKNSFYENLEAKQQIVKNLETQLLPFLELHMGKTMNKATFDEFCQYLYINFGVKNARGKAPGIKIVKPFLKEKGFTLTTPQVDRKTVYIISK
ncbi:DEAD/DEAH box helicase family protein [Cytobacillus praedii]|uniref:DEAD/DEAH box helicase family protein n=1 Tax=Cytobacillus praedii TaxID=1742358 RepID=UPI002E23E696|nr:DEAD/DEAH box helicase family protein [Cytobacillus praedii]MED3552525.1 DEAD/DEAH box helicase family protein [Cytobacillus praedii]